MKLKYIFKKLIFEFFEPNNSYTYEKVGVGLWKYKDEGGNIFFVSCSKVDRNSYLEFETWWEDSSGNKIYDKVPKIGNNVELNKRGNTISKIFRDEIIPMFQSMKKYNSIVILPVTISRYLFTMRMIKKFIPETWKIVETYPKQIVIKK